MTGFTLAATALAATLGAGAPAAPGSPGAAPSSRVTVPGVGDVDVLAPDGTPSRAVVLLSGDSGPDAALRDLARGLAQDGALVTVLDTHAYLGSRATTRCAYPAGDLEMLAQRIQKLRAVPAYERPILVGWSRGASVAWAALSQGPGGTFAGAVQVAPCAHQALPLRLCPGSGQRPRRLGATGELPALAPPPGATEIVVGARDDRCPATDAADLGRALGAHVATVPGARHALDAALAAEARAAVSRIAGTPRAQPPPAPTAPAVEDLPLVEVPAKRPGSRLALLLTGDGGWVGIDKALAAAFADDGVAVVGLDSLRYFWKRRTPEETAKDAARILDHYRVTWDRPDLLLVGYSRGADIVPIVASRLPPEVRARVRLVAMLGPSTFAELEVHAIDLFTSKRRAGVLSTEEAVRACAADSVPMLCVHGEEEHDSLCPIVAGVPEVKDVLLPGGHHFDGGYEALARRVLEAVP